MIVGFVYLLLCGGLAIAGIVTGNAEIARMLDFVTSPASTSPLAREPGMATIAVLAGALVNAVVLALLVTLGIRLVGR